MGGATMCAAQILSGLCPSRVQNENPFAQAYVGFRRLRTQRRFPNIDEASEPAKGGAGRALMRTIRRFFDPYADTATT